MGILTKKSMVMTEVAKCVVAFCLSVVLGLSALLMASFIPDSLISKQLVESGSDLQSEGMFQRVFDHEESGWLDNHTDSLMILATAGMNRQNMESILTNPIYSYDSEGQSTEYPFPEAIELYGSGVTPDGQWYYARYWLGFRAILRVLLVFFHYFQIRRYVAVLFFLLFVCVICSVTKKVDGKTALVFAASVILVRPQVIANSLQFSCCFLIAFSAMLLVPTLVDRPQWDSVFFLELGVLTMFFDFYTIPLITAGFPLVYLAILRSRQGRKVTLRWVLRCVLIWLGAYGLMWLTKLCLTNLFTSFDGIQSGLTSFFGRVGIVKTQGMEEFYDMGVAFYMLQEAIFADNAGRLVYMAGLSLGILGSGACAILFRVPAAAFRRYAYLLLIAALPFVWFAATVQPIAIHYWFQYRSIALTYWAVGAYLSMTCWDRGNAPNMIPAQKL